MAGVFVNAGSASDPDGHPGLAHFVEHTIFKGTRRRSSWHINNRMESVGGELNAFTAKEETFVYTIGPKGSTSRAIELLADLTIGATFPEHEIDVERGVITDEIDSYLDTPAEAVFDDFEDLLFAGSPLGHNILGSRRSVESIGPADCREFIRQNYTADNMVLFYVGPASASRFEALARRHFASLPQSAPIARTAANPPKRKPFDESRAINSHQANTVCGVLTGGRCCPDRVELRLLANILGGPGMNALLNLELREKRGLVYSVDASTTFYTNCGMLAIAFGCEPSNEKRCRNLIAGLLASRLPAMLTPRYVEAAKKQFIGQTILRNDYRDLRAFAAARSAFYSGGNPQPLSAYLDSVRAITPERLRDVAARYLDPAAMSRLTFL